MKKISVLIYSFIVAGLFLTSISGMNAQEKRFVFFRNLDDTTITQRAYYKYFEESKYSDEFLEAQFSDQFFDENNITDFDIAVFPTGNLALQAKTDGGIRVIDKINEMLEAGKSVIIASRLGMSAQYRLDASNDAVKAFFEDTLNIEYLGWRPTSDTSGTTYTFRQFNAKGAPGDLVSNGFNKDCNVISDGVPPIAYYNNVDCFKSTDESKNSPVDYLMPNREATQYSDTLLGVKTITSSGSKIVFWSFGFEVICHDHDREMNLLGAMNWILLQTGTEGPELSFLHSSVNFGDVELGDTTTRSVSFFNNGNETLTITDIKLEEFFTQGIFEIIDSTIPSLPLNLETNEQAKLSIRFMPDEDKVYHEFLQIYSNDIYANNDGFTDIELKGTGGKGFGPVIESNTGEEYDFGEVEPLQQAFAEIIITNTGNRELILNIVDIIEDDENRFTIMYGGQVPKTLAPEEQVEIKIKFVPLDAGKEYQARLKILNTSKNSNEMYITLKGKGKEAGAVDEWAKTKNGHLKVKALPNPFSGKTNIEYHISGERAMNIDMKLYDINGNLLKEILSNMKMPGNYNNSLNVNGLVSGRYYLLIKADNETVQLPLEIVK